jgi:spermidine/putrescine transport system substrate-binding protein
MEGRDMARDRYDGPPPARPQLHRRDLLRGGIYLGAGLGAAPLLGACTDGGTPGVADGEPPYELARPDNPVTQPIQDSNPMIEDGLRPETGGTFKILNYADYIAPSVVNAFEDQYDVGIEVTPYANYDQMLTKLQEPGSSFDLVFPGPSVLSKTVYAGLIQPLNLSYVPNLKNVWPEYEDPWYDKGARYTIPYTVYTTGVGFRTDRVDDPSRGYDLVWDEQYAGKVGILEDSSEAIAMSLQRNNITDDINTTDEAEVAAAVDGLIELIDLVGVKVGINAYRTIPEGAITIHQVWSGEMVGAHWYLPKGTSPDVIGYWRQDDPADRTIGNDCISIPKSATKPVLAHKFLDYILDEGVSERNFNWNGYQPPLTKLSAQYLIDQGTIAPQLETAVVVPDDFDVGKTFYEQSIATQQMWQNQWTRFQSGG